MWRKQMTITDTFHNTEYMHNASVFSFEVVIFLVRRFNHVLCYYVYIIPTEKF